MASAEASQKIKKKENAENSTFSFFLSGGDGGSRTHVRKHFHRNFSERSRCFIVSPLLAPTGRLKNQLSR